MISYSEAVDRAPRPLKRDLIEYEPRTPFGRDVMRALPYLPADLAQELVEHVKRILVVSSRLALVHNRFDGVDSKGKLIYSPIDYGIVSEKVITDAGVNYLVDAWQNLQELENLKFHGLGTGGTAEAASQTALVTELTTQYNPDNTRATGSLTEGASANIFRSVATNTVDAAAAVTEHAIFSQAATGGGTMWDRSLFSVINLAIADSLQSTYDATFTSGG